jgi:hypothetical protein
VARAKKTDRAEARRRYRAETAPADVGAADDGDAAPASAARATRAATPAYSTPSGRVGIGTAFRTAFHPVNIREDLAALPWLLRSRAFLIPLAVTVASSTLVTVTGGRDIITSFLFAYFVQTPPIGGALIAGFLAPRASWLLGFIISLIAAVGYMVFILSVTTGTPDEAIARQALPAAFLASPILGALFAAGAAWYRRFLQLSNPNRGRRAEAKRGADGRSRSSGSPKAPVKR